MKLESQVIGVHIGTPNEVSESIRALVSPRNNWVGALLVRHILGVALERAGLLMPLETCGCCGELSDCIIFASVSDPAAAVAVIRKELGELPLDYRIGVFDGSGWRAVHPSTNARLDWLFDNDRHNAALESLKSAAREHGQNLRSLCQQLREQTATASGPEKRQLDAAILELENATHQASENLAPNRPDTQGDEGNEQNAS